MTQREDVQRQIDNLQNNINCLVEEAGNAAKTMRILAEWAKEYQKDLDKLRAQLAAIPEGDEWKLSGDA